jgi:hypothetical protein
MRKSFTTKQNNVTFSSSLIKPKSNFTKSRTKKNIPSSILKKKIEIEYTKSIENNKQVKTKISLSNFETTVYKMLKNMYPRKRITKANFLTKWENSNLSKYFDTKHVISKELKEKILNPDIRFYIDLSEIRKLNPLLSEELVREYAYVIEEYFKKEFNL